MKNYRTVQSADPFPAMAPSENERELEVGFQDDRHGCLPEGWQELPLSVRGARLYYIASPDGDDAWLGEIIVHGEVLRRRCTSELRARAWLAMVDKPRFPLTNS